MHMDAIWFISPLVRFIGIVIPPIQKYFSQPKLYFVVTWNSTFKAAGIPSIKNIENKTYELVKAIFVSPIEWDYTITIRNNSEINAYNLKLLKPTVNSNVSIEPYLDDLKPLVSNSEVSYDIKLKIRAEANSAITEEIMRSKPEQFKDEYLVLEYTNSNHIKFYTVFDYGGNGKGQNHLFTEYEFNLIKAKLGL